MFIDKNQNDYGVRKLCVVLDVSVSGYYDWKKRPVNYRKAQETRLLQEIRQTHLDSKESYGFLTSQPASFSLVSMSSLRVLASSLYIV